MSRERTFSPAEVIDHVADVFASHGYGGASVAMLAEASGLGKQSLYNAFGNKQDLYLRAVDCAAARFGSIAGPMQRAPSGRAAIDAYFEHLIAHCASDDPAQRSCIVSAGLLEGIDEPTVRLALQAKWQAAHELLRATIERGQRDASIASTAPSAALADMLMSLMSGLRVTARADVDPARLRATVALGLRVLDQP